MEPLSLICSEKILISPISATIGSKNTVGLWSIGVIATDKRIVK